MSIRVLICDDQDLVRDGLTTILSNAPGIEVAGVASGGDQAIVLTTELEPDVVLMDLNMPGTNGIAATRAITDRHPEVRVLVLTTYDAPEWVDDAVRAGAAGYLMKDTTRQRLIDAIRGTAEGKTHLDPSVAGRLLDQVSVSPRVGPDSTVTEGLSEREIEVLKALGRGLTNSEIASRLFLSEGTIRNYVSSIITKLDVSDRTQAAVIAVRHGIVDTD